ncbi:TM2 domain-containing protein [Fimbriimonas ginsengisoli]|uniref:TM2 domain containing protein n=1 Tax=Fimbriimonas ginsengisoli Gsoil 348 TaxID=661478 RepID=A0A068NN95_FIMGI|nr:TM2 domain-containing protein [Fimbriimonas ginsengisoli]AIE84220.1 TM2 domain containing protein [Fimbriimonas ginsengisoli Gsoil 348]
MYKVIGADGQIYGPVDVGTLQQWCQEGRIVADSRLVDPSGQIVNAAYVPALSGFLTAPGYPTQTGYSSYPRGYAAPASSKSKVAGILLAFFLGYLGIHRFYLGHMATGTAILVLTIAGFLTCGITSLIAAVWALVDCILIATGGLTDASGQPLT